MITQWELGTICETCGQRIEQMGHACSKTATFKDAEIEKLKNELADAQSEAQSMKYNWLESKREVARLKLLREGDVFIIETNEKQIHRLVAALKLYADPASWRTPSGKVGITILTDGRDAEIIDGHWTGGKAARAALKTE